MSRQALASRANLGQVTRYAVANREPAPGQVARYAVANRAPAHGLLLIARARSILEFAHEKTGGGFFTTNGYFQIPKSCITLQLCKSPSFFYKPFRRYLSEIYGSEYPTVFAMNTTLNHEPIKVCQQLCFRYKSVVLLLTNVHPGVSLNMGIRSESRLLSSHTDLFTLKSKQAEIARAIDEYHYLNFQCQDNIVGRSSLLYYLYVIYG